MGKIVPRGTTPAINEILAEVNNILESRDYDLMCYYVGNTISFICTGMNRTVQLRSHSGHRVMVTLNLPTAERQVMFGTLNRIKDAASYIADSFLPRILTLPEREALYEEHCKALEREAIQSEQLYPAVVRVLRMPSHTNDDRHDALDVQGVSRFGTELDNVKDV